MRLRRPDGHRAGATLIESAIVYPSLFLIVLAIIVGGMGVFRYQEVAKLSRLAARYASVHGSQYAADKPSAATVNKAFIYTNVVKPNNVSLDLTKLSMSIKINTRSGVLDWDDTTTQTPA